MLVLVLVTITCCVKASHGDLLATYYDYLPPISYTSSFQSKIHPFNDPLTHLPFKAKNWYNKGLVTRTNYYAIEWVGSISARVSGHYTLSYRVDDGLKIWINESLVFQSWVVQGPEAGRETPSFYLDPVGFPIRIAYYQDLGGTALELNSTSGECCDFPGGLNATLYYYDPTAVIGGPTDVRYDSTVDFRCGTGHFRKQERIFVVWTAVLVPPIEFVHRNISVVVATPGVDVWLTGVWVEMDGVVLLDWFYNNNGCSSRNAEVYLGANSTLKVMYTALSDCNISFSWGLSLQSVRVLLPNETVPWGNEIPFPSPAGPSPEPISVPPLVIPIVSPLPGPSPEPLSISPVFIPAPDLLSPTPISLPSPSGVYIDHNTVFQGNFLADYLKIANTSTLVINGNIYVKEIELTGSLTVNGSISFDTLIISQSDLNPLSSPINITGCLSNISSTSTITIKWQNTLTPGLYYPIISSNCPKNSSLPIKLIPPETKRDSNWDCEGGEYEYQIQQNQNSYVLSSTLKTGCGLGFILVISISGGVLFIVLLIFLMYTIHKYYKYEKALNRIEVEDEL
eukprot:TRINITY_DN19200_c0_g1_i2.p1 TRINITY_DN19200_c0_g1~~TRINITY_DN19200_c0_g1_i2.p1  ORF type:complete len:603 (+),score=103.42 TRINITY_DN19200_c0_g1_i2:109-1809(+)